MNISCELYTVKNIFRPMWDGGYYLRYIVLVIIVNEG